MASNRQAARTAERTRERLSIVPEPGDQPIGLNMQERLILARMLPAQGNLLTLRTAERCRQAMEFSEDEAAFLEDMAVDLPDGGKRYRFDSERSQADVDIVLSPRAFVLIAKALRDLDKAEKLEPMHLSLWAKFVPADEQG